MPAVQYPLARARYLLNFCVIHSCVATSCGMDRKGTFMYFAHITCNGRFSTLFLGFFSLSTILSAPIVIVFVSWMISGNLFQHFLLFLIRATS